MGIAKNHIGLPCILLFLLFSAGLRAQSAMKKSEEKLADLFQMLGQGDHANTKDINDSIEAEFLSILSAPGSMSYNFPSIANDLTITVSTDKKLRFISWNSKLGGTMDYIKVVSQFMAPDKKLYTQSIKNESSPDFDQAVRFDQLIPIGPDHYLAMGHGKYDMRERAYSAYSFKIVNNTLSDSARIFCADSVWTNSIHNYYNAYMDDPKSAEIAYNAAGKHICYTRFQQDENKAIYLDSENICLLFDGSTFRRKK